MMLIGQFDSPFTRRVAITMRLYGMPFDHRPWSVFGDADRISAHNPLLRVPTLVLDDGIALVDSQAILDHLDGLVEPGRRLMPSEGHARAEAMRICAVACGIGDKAVALFYELRLHEAPSAFYVERCHRQIRDGLVWLEQAYAERPGPFWAGEALSQPDITVAAILRHLGEAHPDPARLDGYPRLAALAAMLEATEIFREISQPFVAPSA
ncbi:MAG: glutathione S-transferase family protein [Rhabdaerophilum sp.]